MRYAILLPLLAGCAATQRSYQGEYLPVIAVACGVSEVIADGEPAPAVCATCEGKGRLPIRDTGRFEDCPDCETTPARAEAAPTTEGAPEPAAEPLPEWLTWEEAKGSDRPVLVFQHFARAEDRNACKACKRLEITLKDEETLKELGKLGVLVSDTAERWQGTDTPTAPAVALVPPGASETDKVKTLTGFRVSPPAAFMEDLKRWLDAND